MALNNPIVGAKGLWELNEPYNTLLPVNMALSCTAISNYGQLYAMGIDVYETYYKPHSISQEVFKQHQDEEGRIVFLSTDAGVRYSFPLHYLHSYPIGQGVNYASIGIGIRLGALPLNTNLALMVEQLREVCNLNTGVAIQIETMALSDTMVVSNEEHARLEKARAAKKREQTPSLEKITNLTEQTRRLQTELRIAEEKVIQLDNEVKALKARQP